MSLTRISSSWFSSNVVSSTSSGSMYRPAKISVGAGDPGRGVAQALPVGVLADRDEQLADRGLGAGLVEAVHVRAVLAAMGLRRGAVGALLRRPNQPCAAGSGGGHVCPAGVVAGRHPGGGS